MGLAENQIRVPSLSWKLVPKAMGRAEALLERGRQLVCLLWKASGVCFQGPAVSSIKVWAAPSAASAPGVMCMGPILQPNTAPKPGSPETPPRGVQCHPHPFCWLYISHSQVQSLHVRTQAAVTIWL